MKRINNLISRILFIVFQYPRVIKYKLLSNIKYKVGDCLSKQPVLMLGQGNISFGEKVIFGVLNSPGYLNGLSYLEARSSSAKITIGDHVWLNNNFTAISDGAGILIGSNCLIGFNVSVFDSDFHSLNSRERRSNVYPVKEVVIGENVFIGSNVTILKGVTIGNNSVIASGAIVTKSIPPNVIAGGNPCIVIKEIMN